VFIFVEPLIYKPKFMSSEEVVDIKKRQRSHSMGNKIFERTDRFADSTKNVNFRIGPKSLGPNATSYNRPSTNSSFTNGRTFN
jgi:hypothetical protein